MNEINEIYIFRTEDLNLFSKKPVLAFFQPTPNPILNRYSTIGILGAYVLESANLMNTNSTMISRILKTFHEHIVIPLSLKLVSTVFLFFTK